MTELPYICKFCGTSRVAEYDPECPIVKLEVWRKMLACNRCADFEVVRLDLIRGTDRYGVALIRARLSMRHSREKLKAFEAQIAERLTAVTRKYTNVVCDHLGLMRQWDSEFVTLIMERPDAVTKIMDMYYQNNRRATKQQEMTAV